MTNPTKEALLAQCAQIREMLAEIRRMTAEIVSADREWRGVAVAHAAKAKRHADRVRTLRRVSTIVRRSGAALVRDSRMIRALAGQGAHDGMERTLIRASDWILHLGEDLTMQSGTWKTAAGMEPDALAEFLDELGGLVDAIKDGAVPSSASPAPGGPEVPEEPAAALPGRN